ncbi:hypothetical protein WDJ51_09065 [Rathayibacter sp. YIM 133350]|uniref:hypothetical protein n=1 Tax=Rathayibacter sp. YIM 133350 TaxID=3131992 RepID=UPI00307D5D31
MAERRPLKLTGARPPLAIKPPRRPVGSLRLWSAIAIVVLLGIDIVLVGTALAGPTAPVPTDTPRQFTSTPTPTDAPASTPSPTATDQPGAAPAGSKPSLTLLAAVDDTDAWRATPGNCGGDDAVIESSNDGGDSWQAHPTRDAAIHEVLSLQAVSATTAFVVAKAGPDCAVGFYRTFSSGVTWEEDAADFDDRSYLDPADAGKVVLNGNAQAAPCPAPRQLAQTDGLVAVLCDGSIALATDADTPSWRTIDAPNAVALSADAGRLTVARTADGSCPTVSITSIAATDERLAAATACAPGDKAPASVALTTRDNTTWLQQDAATALIAP